MKIEANLTKREEEIGSLIACGAIKKEVADRLHISVHTVENHVRNIFEKTECHSVNELSAWYFCSHFGISVELSPLKNVIASLLLAIYLTGNVMQSIDDFSRYRIARRSIARTERFARRVRNKDDYQC